MPLRLTDRAPRLSAAELVPRFVPPRRFASVRFDTYVPNPAHPSQGEALAAVQRFAQELSPRDRPGRRFPFRRGPAPASPPGLYLDGGFGVGKTHLLASLWHAAPGPKAYLTFEELAAVIGFLGMEQAVEAFSGYRLLCIDEFELDDVANILMSVTFLRSVIAAGTRVAATSNALPDRMGEGRYNADDFRRETAAISSHFDVLRIEGPDYRAASRPATTAALDPARLAALAAGPGAVTLDPFDALLAHLRRVHPVQFGPMLDGLDAVLVEGLRPIDNQGSALLFVQLVDELYDAEVVFGATGCDVGEVFPPSYRNGGYRKKYGRCESRLAAMLGETAAG